MSVNTSKTIIGGKGHGRMMTLISMTKKQFLSFEAFCQIQKYDYKVIQQTANIYQISCEKKCIEHFSQSRCVIAR